MTIKSFDINQQIQKTITIFSSFSGIQLAALTLLADIVITLLFSFVFFPGNTSGPNIESNTEGFVISVIVAPIIETYIFQSWLIKKTLAYSNNNKFLALAVSAIAFGIGHHYSVAYVLKATIAGTLYAFMFLTISEKKLNPFFYIVAAHAAFNCIGFIIN